MLERCLKAEKQMKLLVSFSNIKNENKVKRLRWKSDTISNIARCRFCRKKSVTGVKVEDYKFKQLS